MSGIDVLRTPSLSSLRGAIQVVIPAGGFATRLGSLTTNLPKALLPVHGRPFLYIVADWLIAQGVRRVHLCLGHMHEQIISTISELPPGLHVTYTVEDTPRGVAGALRLALDHLEEPFVLLYGDVLPRITLSEPVEHFLKAGQEAILTVVPQQLCREPGNVCVQQGRVIRYIPSTTIARGTHLDTGITVSQRSAVESIPESVFVTEKEWYQKLAACGMLGAFETNQRSFEIGSREGYSKLCSSLLR